MKPFIEIMRLLRGDKWQRDALAADAVRFIETGDPAALARLQKARRPKWWGGLLDALDQHYATPTDADWRVYQTAAILLSAEDVRTWLKGSERKGRIWAPVLPRIMRFDEQQFRGLALKVARDTLDAAAGAGPPWTTETFGVEVLPNALSCLERGAAEGQWGCALRQSFLTRMVKAMGKEALPAVLFGLQDEWIHRTAVGHLIDLDDGTHAGLIQQALEAGLQHKDSGEVIDYVELATRWRLEVLAERLWSLLEHKSKLVREAAARALSRLGEAALPRAGQLLRHRKADVRLAVVGLLAAVGTTAALDLLKPWADKDSSGFVQDAIRKVLASAGVAGPSVGRDAILARV
ncbi:MAG TPA: HEAT repeat domain-containing protein, partial [Gemmataceae bacterium]|nr:HEAT repeat domain-containing protein [Gemmataceae bacterium]